jgi:hypothetical protein
LSLAHIIQPEAAFVDTVARRAPLDVLTEAIAKLVANVSVYPLKLKLNDGGTTALTATVSPVTATVCGSEMLVELIRPTSAIEEYVDIDPTVVSLAPAVGTVRVLAPDQLKQ